MQYLVLLRSVNTHVSRRAIVGNFIVECRQLWYFYKVAETLFLYNVVSDIKLKVGGFLSEDCRPRIKATDVLTLQFTGTQVLEQQVKFRQ